MLIFVCCPPKACCGLAQADDDAVIRKQARAVLEGASKGSSSPTWPAMLAVLNSLEDFSIHVVKATWDKVL